MHFIFNTCSFKQKAFWLDWNLQYLWTEGFLKGSYLQAGENNILYFSLNRGQMQKSNPSFNFGAARTRTSWTRWCQPPLVILDMLVLVRYRSVGPSSVAAMGEFFWEGTTWYSTLWDRISFFKDGPTPASFHLFLSFCTENLSSQQDSNSDCRSRRQERWPLDHHHGPEIECLKIFDLKKSWLDAL